MFKPIQSIDEFLPEMTFDKHFLQTHGDLWFRVTEEVLSTTTSQVAGLGKVIVLGGYSYLGLNGHPQINRAVKEAIDQFGTGVTGSRFLTGTLSLHEQLEQEIASFKKSQAALVLTSGYLTNLTTLSTLMREGDLIISDELNHASIIDGCRFSKATTVRFKHNDMNHLEDVLRQATVRFKLVVVDGVYSVDGDIADLPAISYLCKQYSAFLMVDEAHSLGVLGKTGRGIEEYFDLPDSTVDIKMGTLSKTIPAHGGYIAGSQKLCDFLKHSSRGFIFSGAVAPTTAAAALAGFKIIQAEPERVEQLRKNVTRFSQKLIQTGLLPFEPCTPIVPIVCGSIAKASALASYCAEHNIFVHALMPPIVPEGACRLRVSIMATHSFEELDYCADTIIAGAKKLGII